MATVNAKAFRMTPENRPILQCFIAEPIPEDTKYLLASSEGYLFFNSEPAIVDALGEFRMPRLSILSYYDIAYESE